jgi:hypothetical protein
MELRPPAAGEGRYRLPVVVPRGSTGRRIAHIPEIPTNALWAFLGVILSVVGSCLVARFLWDNFLSQVVALFFALVLWWILWPTHAPRKG